jgi:hypothetical protein
MCLPLTWADVPIVGIGFDIAGAIIVAWSLSANSAEKISKDVPIHGISLGLAPIARGSARQRAEARMGIVFLVGGFLLQATAYFFPHPSASLHSWHERAAGCLLLLVTWVIAAAGYRLYVPWSAERVFDTAQRSQKERQEESDRSQRAES